MDTQSQTQPQQPVEVKQTHPNTTDTTAVQTYAGIGSSAIALIIDTLITMFAAGFLSAFLKDSNIGGLLVGLVALGYFIGMEGYNNGQTLGKIATGIKVLSQDGKPITVQQALIRNLLRIVDGLPFFYIVGIIIASSSPLKQRFGDKIAKTVVIKK